MDEKVQEICRAFEDESNERKAAEGNRLSVSVISNKSYFPKTWCKSQSYLETLVWEEGL